MRALLAVHSCQKFTEVVSARDARSHVVMAGLEPSRKALPAIATLEVVTAKRSKAVLMIDLRSKSVFDTVLTSFLQHQDDKVIDSSQGWPSRPLPSRTPACRSRRPA